jgi:beta-galactosidase/beta-glucuronidase
VAGIESSDAPVHKNLRKARIERKWLARCFGFHVTNPAEPTVKRTVRQIWNVDVTHDSRCFTSQGFSEVLLSLDSRLSPERYDPLSANKIFRSDEAFDPAICRLRAAIINGEFMNQIAAGIIVWLILSVPLFATTRVDLDSDWLFRIDPNQAGETSSWQKRPPSNADSVSVPHTWNLGRDEGYLGKAWYFKTFDMAMQPAESHVKLHFGATFYFARVWLNGVEIGTHEGGYTAYSFDITRHLRRTNYLAVEIDNRISATSIPGLAQRGEDNAWYDWWDYGGIVRDVWLTLGGPVQVLRQRIRSQINEDGATVEDCIFLENGLLRKKQVSAVIAILGPDNQSAARETHSVSVVPGVAAITLSLKLPDPKLWGIDHPNMYRIVVNINDADGILLDENSDAFGVRKVEIRDRHLLINGDRVRLTGVTRHEDSTWEGLAETPGTMLHDYDDMKGLQVTLTRPVHYPQNPFILDYADRHGILLIPEIPVWQFSEAQLKNPKVLALAKQQMREMIEEAGNHPSIFAWSVCNESDMGTPGGIAYFRAMRDLTARRNSETLRRANCQGVAALTEGDTASLQASSELLILAVLYLLGN